MAPGSRFTSAAAIVDAAGKLLESTMRTQPPRAADELRRQADNFIELEELKPQIAREGGPRSNPMPQTYAQSA